MFQRILVPVDGSTVSFHALDWAIQIALGEQAAITALCVIDARVSHEARVYLPAQEGMGISEEKYPPSKVDSTYQDWSRQISSLVQSRGEAAYVEVYPEVITGIPYREIISRSSAYDLLVMGAWNITGSYPGPFLAGSTLRQVVTHTQLPTLCVTGQPQKLETILVVYDDTLQAQDALQLATTWAQAWDLTLTVLVIQPDGEQTQALLQQARRRVEPLNPRLIAREGDPAEIIIEIAVQNHCNLISLSVPPRHIWQSHSLGRTIDTLLHTGGLPLLLSH